MFLLGRPRQLPGHGPGGHLAHPPRLAPRVDLAATPFKAAVPLTPGDVLSIAGELLTAAAAQLKAKG